MNTTNPNPQTIKEITGELHFNSVASSFPKPSYITVAGKGLKAKNVRLNLAFEGSLPFELIEAIHDRVVSAVRCHKELVDKVAYLRTQIPAWKDASKEQPDTDRDVLVFTSNGKEVAIFDTIRSKWIDVNFKPINPSRWQELPQDPE